ncbi:MAG TPA: SEFIR domain-containing protein [Actinophytocola sp.]|uniref:SEFIR domain-containing protein n=1 Tax=Actinophytocola sp. TaxID=1872138 RepID=UPI002DB90691|nr:SEFIR domain-containing protein [Actinophytocola sp.]HEU5470935.1 SEFIR domain-containing protein [Actinophytocola sp.]
MTAPKVFVSYAHDSLAHQNDVLAFAHFLRGQGVDAVLDLWSADARHDWYAWALREMTSAAYVIVVASPAYRAVGDGSAPGDRHPGIQSEATLLRDLLHGDRPTWTAKVLPVLLPGHGIEEIPRFLSPYTATRFTVTACTTTGAEDLLRVIHRSPGHVRPPVLPAPDLPPRPVPAAVVWCAAMPGDVGQPPGSVEVHLVPSEPLQPQSARDMQRALSARSPRAARLDPAGSMAWITTNGTGVAVLDTGQRSAWFTPAGPDRNQLAATLAERLALLVAIDLDRPAAWTPAAGFGAARHVLPQLANADLHPVELAERLADQLLADEPATPSRVTNVITGNVSGRVVQAGDIHGGVHF